MASSQDVNLMSLEDLLLELEAAYEDLWESVQGRLPRDVEDTFVAVLGRMMAVDTEIARRTVGVPAVASRCRMPCPSGRN